MIMGLFYLFSNGVGMDGDEVRTGGAMILDTNGDILVESWKPQEEMVVAPLDAALREKSPGTAMDQGRADRSCMDCWQSQLEMKNRSARSRKATVKFLLKVR